MLKLEVNASRHDRGRLIAVVHGDLDHAGVVELCSRAYGLIGPWCLTWVRHGGTTGRTTGPWPGFRSGCGYAVSSSPSALATPR